jgi:prophage antirepressor-like protein
MQLIPHVFEDQLVRSVTLEDGPWFVGKDVCRVLEVKDHHQALERLDNDERGTCSVPTPQGEQSMIVVCEAGVFRLIFSSRKPEAERFKRWLAHEVLPSLRRTGRYGAAEASQPVLTEDAVPMLTVKLAMVREARHLFGQNRARSLWERVGLPIPHLAPDGSQEDARNCLEQVLGHRPAGQDITLRMMIENALNDDEGADIILLSHGIRVCREPTEGFIVANRHPLIAELFAATDWNLNSHQRVLRRLTGALPAPKHRYGAFQARGTFIPVQYLEELPLI